LLSRKKLQKIILLYHVNFINKFDILGLSFFVAVRDFPWHASKFCYHSGVRFLRGRLEKKEKYEAR